MEPPPRFELGASPYQGRALTARAMEARAGEARFGRALSSFKGLSGAGYPIPIRAPTGCYPRLVVLTRNARTLVPGAKRRRRRNVETYRKTAVSRSLVRQRWLPLALSGVTNPTASWSIFSYARRESNPQQLGPQPSPSSYLRHERMEPPPGADPGHPPYESGDAAVRGGEAGHPGLEPGNSGVRARRVCQIPLLAIGCGRCDSNAHAASSELARYAKIPVTPAWCAARDSNPDRDTG